MKDDQKNYESRMIEDVYGPPLYCPPPIEKRKTEMESCVYGPPPIEKTRLEMRSCVYGPPPINNKRKKRLIFIIAGLVGLVIAFFGVRKMMSTVYGPQPCVYGPAPIDYEEELSPTDSDMVSSSMDYEGNEYE